MPWLVVAALAALLVLYVWGAARPQSGDILPPLDDDLDDLEPA